MRSICFDKERVGQWVGQKIENSVWCQYSAIGLEQEGELIAGVVFNDYVKDVRCSIHCAGIGKRWLTREFLWIIFDYAFNQLNCKVIINYVNSTNSASLKFTEHIGFKHEHSIKDAGKASDLMIFSLYQKDCQWQNNEQFKRKYYAV